MFGIGGLELFLILLFAFLIVGPDRLPEIATTVGKALNKFKKAQNEVQGALDPKSFYDPNSDDPFKNPLDALAKSADALADMPENLKNIITEDESKPVEGADAAEAAGSETSGTDAEAEAEKAPRQESFSERKARYERERAARLAAQEEAAKREAQIEEAKEKSAKLVEKKAAELKLEQKRASAKVEDASEVASSKSDAPNADAKASAADASSAKAVTAKKTSARAVKKTKAAPAPESQSASGTSSAEEVE